MMEEGSNIRTLAEKGILSEEYADIWLFLLKVNELSEEDVQCLCDLREKIANFAICHDRGAIATSFC